MRHAIIALALSVVLAGCGAKMEDGSKPPVDAMTSASETKISTSTKISILRDASTGCDYIAIDGNSANAVRPRTRGRNEAVCDGTPAAGFTVVSAGDLPGIDVVRLRDRGTGCLWLWIDGNKSGDITAVIAKDGAQLCDAPESGGTA